MSIELDDEEIKLLGLTDIPYENWRPVLTEEDIALSKLSSEERLILKVMNNLGNVIRIFILFLFVDIWLKLGLTTALISAALVIASLFSMVYYSYIEKKLIHLRDRFELLQDRLAKRAEHFSRIEDEEMYHRIKDQLRKKTRNRL